MNEISKYISLKQYVPIGTPEISNFELKSEEISNYNKVNKQSRLKTGGTFTEVLTIRG